MMRAILEYGVRPGYGRAFNKIKKKKKMNHRAQLMLTWRLNMLVKKN